MLQSMYYVIILDSVMIIILYNEKLFQIEHYLNHSALKTSLDGLPG